jgi:hypothetical protein
MSEQSMKDPYRYTPGNGYVYVWNGGPWITIYQVKDRSGRRVEEQLPDVIPAPPTRTAAALMAAVADHRNTHQA